jgi:2,4-dienoyl-CoA reductase-like NADH-dependent reductase (Old Yellow Enzyme family)
MNDESRTPAYLRAGRLGRLTLKNRLVRAATSETMATEAGDATPELVAFYERLARGGAGLIITGHIFVAHRGQCSPRQMGLDTDARVPGLRRVTDAVHAGGGRIFAELSHAGSQSMMPDRVPLAPSVVTNPIYARHPDEASEADIADTVAAFAAAARRAKEAGFDGVHLHGGNGYLIAEFSSPHSNRRTDGWGGDAAGRARFSVAVCRAVRAAVGPDYPVTMRIGLADSVPDGLEVAESLDRAALLAAEGVDGFEVTLGIMGSYLENIRPYVAVSPRRAAEDWLVPRLWRPAAPEAYYRDFARALRARVGLPIILVGGVRTTDMMEELVASGDADFLALSRPFIREPDLPNRLIAGHRGMPDCVSCNICLAHDGYDALKCWRKNPADLAAHALFRLRGELGRIAARFRSAPPA